MEHDATGISQSYVLVDGGEGATTNFDEMLRSKIELSPSKVDDKSPDGIWKAFQPTFVLIMELFAYAPFYKQLLKQALQSHIAQNVFIVEYRYMTGSIFNDNKEKLSLKEELQLNREVLDEIREDTPHFQFKLIYTSLKAVGKKMIQSQIDNILQGNELEDERLKELISPGLDMVGEEDSSNQIDYFAE